jgi:hypothetical protein
VGDGLDRAGLLAGVAADANARVDEVLLGEFGGAHRNSQRRKALTTENTESTEKDEYKIIFISVLSVFSVVQSF